MAIINSSLAYSGKKKLGTIILRTLKGQLIASQYQPNVSNPRSLGQMESRLKMRATVESYKIVQNICTFAIKEFKKVRSQYNEFVSLNKSFNTIENEETYIMNWEKIQISKGSLEEVENLEIEYNSDLLSCVYKKPTFENPNNGNDEIYLAVVFPELESSLYKKISLRNQAGNISLDLSNYPAGSTFYCYGFSVNPSSQKGSKTKYFKKFTLS